MIDKLEELEKLMKEKYGSWANMSRELYGNNSTLWGKIKPEVILEAIEKAKLNNPKYGFISDEDRISMRKMYNNYIISEVDGTIMTDLEFCKKHSFHTMFVTRLFNGYQKRYSDDVYKFLKIVR